MNLTFDHPIAVHAALAAVGDRHGLRIVDLLPTACVSHPTDPQPVVFLAEKSNEALSLVDLCSAEVDLQDRLGYAVRILLKSELEAHPHGRELLEERRGL